MNKTIGANYRLTRFLDKEEIADLKRAIRECWQEIKQKPDWVSEARSLK